MNAILTISAVALCSVVVVAGEAVGSHYCTHGPDYDCFETGWPSCCSNDAEDCPEEMPGCDFEVACDLCTEACEKIKKQPKKKVACFENCKETACNDSDSLGPDSGHGSGSEVDHDDCDICLDKCESIKANSIKAKRKKDECFENCDANECDDSDPFGSGSGSGSEIDHDDCDICLDKCESIKPKFKKKKDDCFKNCDANECDDSDPFGSGSGSGSDFSKCNADHSAEFSVENGGCCDSGAQCVSSHCNYFTWTCEDNHRRRNLRA